MDQSTHEQWQHELEHERFTLTLEALQRCAAAGAKQEDLIVIARECGIDPKYITHRRSAAVG